MLKIFNRGQLKFLLLFSIFVFGFVGLGDTYNIIQSVVNPQTHGEYNWEILNTRGTNGSQLKFRNNQATYIQNIYSVNNQLPAGFQYILNSGNYIKLNTYTDYFYNLYIGQENWNDGPEISFINSHDVNEGFLNSVAGTGQTHGSQVKYEKTDDIYFRFLYAQEVRNSSGEFLYNSPDWIAKPYMGITFDDGTLFYQDYPDGLTGDEIFYSPGGSTSYGRVFNAPNLGIAMVGGFNKSNYQVSWEDVLFRTIGFEYVDQGSGVYDLISKQQDGVLIFSLNFIEQQYGTPSTDTMVLSKDPNNIHELVYHIFDCYSSDLNELLNSCSIKDKGYVKYEFNSEYTGFFHNMIDTTTPVSGNGTPIRALYDLSYGSYAYVNLDGDDLTFNQDINSYHYPSIYHFKLFSSTTPSNIGYLVLTGGLYDDVVYTTVSYMVDGGTVPGQTAIYSSGVYSMLEEISVYTDITDRETLLKDSSLLLEKASFFFNGDDFTDRTKKDGIGHIINGGEINVNGKYGSGIGVVNVTGLSAKLDTAFYGSNANYSLVPFSFSIDVQHIGNSDPNWLIGNGTNTSAPNLFVSGNFGYIFYVDSGSVSHYISFPFAYGDWHNIIWVYDGKFQIFIDGVQKLYTEDVIINTQSQLFTLAGKSEFESANEYGMGVYDNIGYWHDYKLTTKDIILLSTKDISANSVSFANALKTFYCPYSLDGYPSIDLGNIPGVSSLVPSFHLDILSPIMCQYAGFKDGIKQQYKKTSSFIESNIFDGKLFENIHTFNGDIEVDSENDLLLFFLNLLLGLPGIVFIYKILLHD